MLLDRVAGMTGPRRKTRIAVVFGGTSPEHSVSCVSAGSVMSALDRDRYDVLPVGIARDGRWLLLADDPQALAMRDRELPAVTEGRALELSNDPNNPGLRIVESASAPAELAGVDVVFPVLHGDHGEDGTIQGLFEMIGLPYVGEGVFSSAAAMDKEFTKKLLAADGLPVGTYVVLRRGAELGATDRDRLGLPVFVKPARAGSSIGITRVDDWAEFGAAVRTARAVDPKVIVEAAVVGREVECAVLAAAAGSGQRARASLPAEIRMVGSHDWYDFEAKYLEDASEFDIPADLDPKTIEELQHMAVRAFEALDGQALARVDFFVTGHGLIVNEVNTMPGFTPISMYPKMWEASGLAYPDLLDELIALGLSRAAARSAGAPD